MMPGADGKLRVAAYSAAVCDDKSVPKIEDELARPYLYRWSCNSLNDAPSLLVFE